MPRKRRRKLYKTHLYKPRSKFTASRNFDDPKYKQWRQAVYKRDSYKCQMPGCKYRGRHIQAHHIIRWADAVDLRFDVNNGICLCINCHKLVTNNEIYYISLFHTIIQLKKDKELK